MNILLALMSDIVRAYAAQHHPEALDPDQHIIANVHQGDESWEENETMRWLSHVLSGWWVISPDLGWSWWLGVYDVPPAGQDLTHFPHCRLDAPLPDAKFPGWPSRYRSHPDHPLYECPQEVLNAARNAMQEAVDAGDVSAEMRDPIADMVVMDLMDFLDTEG